MEKAYKIALAKRWAWKNSTQNMCKNVQNHAKISKNAKNCTRIAATAPTFFHLWHLANELSYYTLPWGCDIIANFIKTRGHFHDNSSCPWLYYTLIVYDRFYHVEIYIQGNYSRLLLSRKIFLKCQIISIYLLGKPIQWWY